MQDTPRLRSAGVLRVFGLIGVIVALALLWQLGQPVEPRYRPALVRGASAVLFVLAILLAGVAVYVHGALYRASQSPTKDADDYSTLRDGPLFLLTLGLATVGLLGVALAGLRYLRVFLSFLNELWLEWRIMRMDARYDPGRADTDQLHWFFQAFRMMRQVLGYVFLDIGARIFTFIYLFFLGIGFAISHLALVLVIPFMVQALIRRNTIGAVCLFGLLLYFGGMFATTGLSQDDLWSTGSTARFLPQIGRDEALMIYRFALFMVIIAAAMTRIALVWVPVGGLAFGALLYLLMDTWPCLPMLRACMPDPEATWGYPATGLLLFASIHALDVVLRRRSANG